jgi:hypothetical protein
MPSHSGSGAHVCSLSLSLSHTHTQYTHTHTHHMHIHSLTPTYIHNTHTTHIHTFSHTYTHHPPTHTHTSWINVKEFALRCGAWNDFSVIKSTCCSFVCLLFFFRDRVSLCSPGCPGTQSVDQDGLHLTDLRASG